MRSSRLVTGLLATLAVALSACPAPTPPDTGTAPTLSEAALPETTLEVKYTASLSASGGKTPYTFSAQGLPPGLQLASDSGALSGFAAAAGDFQVQVTVKDASGKQSSKSYPLKVYSAVSFKQATLPQATAEAPYSATIEAEGGKAPLTLRLSAGDLPPGVSFNAARGQLSGTPPSFGTFAIAIEATDVHGAKATQQYAVVVAGPLRLFTSSLPAGNVGKAYSQTLSTSGGRAPFTFSLESGTLPAGLSLSHDTLAGTPLTAGRSSFVVKVTDANGATATGSLTLDVYSQLPPRLATTTLTEGLVGREYTQVLAGADGAPPYTFTVTSGALPAGLQLSTGGVLSGTPTTTGTASFQVSLTDSNGQVARGNLTLRVSSLLSVQTASLTEAYKDQTFTQTLSASGGVPPYRWEAQGALPAGFTLSTGGVLSGTSTTAGTYGLTLSVSDSAGQTVSTALQLSVLTPPALTTPSLADGAVGEAYSQRLQASGGKAPYTFALSGGALPPGLSLSGDTLTGTPTGAVTSSLTLQVTDANGKSSQRDYALRIFTGLTITTGTLQDAYAGRAYSFTLSAVAGATPYSWAPVGNLPAGLSLSAAGVLSGTPTTPGTPTLTVQVNDAANTKASRTFDLRIFAQPSVATGSLPEAFQGVAYSATLSGAEGLAPYQWSLSAGTLPPGLTLSSEGVLSGTPTTAGTASFTVELTDANGVKATRALSLTVTPFTVTTTTLGDGYVGQAYSATLTASGGVTPLSWQLTGLPSGLTVNASTGVVSGQPAAAGTATVTVRVTDAQSRVATRDLPLAVYALPQVTTASLPEGAVGAAYTQQLDASQGKAPYTWSLTAGTLHQGLSVSTSPAPWAVRGTPTESGPRTLTLQVTDANGKTASRDFTLNVTGPLALSTASLPGAYLNMAYDVTLSATGGKPPYTFDRASGNLPGGLSLSTTGRLSGTVASNATTSTFTARVTDANSTQATRSFTLTVGNGPQVTTALLTPATEGVAYRRSEASTERLEAIDGQAPYTWSGTGLPAGLTLNASTGELLGTPAQGSEGSYTITFMVTDAGGVSGSKALTLEVGKPRPAPTGGVVGLAPQGSRITDTLTVFTYSSRRPMANVGVRVRKNGVEYSPIKQALTNAEGKVVFTGLGLNGTTDTVDITANGKELVNTTHAQVNASIVTLALQPLTLLGRQLASNAYDASSGRFLVFGGNRGGPTNTLFTSTCASDTVEPVAVAQRDFRTVVQGGLSTSPSPRYDAPMAVANGVAVLFGGRSCETFGDALGDTWEFTLATNTWQKVPTAAGQPSPRTGAALVRGPTGNQVYLVGGYRLGSPYSNEVWRYDPSANSWTLVGTAPFSRFGMASTLNTSTGELWFCGGRSPTVSAECRSYNPTTNVWTLQPSLPSSRYDFAMAYDPNTQNLYAFGGRQNTTTYYGDLLVLRKNATVWESVIPTGDTPPARSGHALYYDTTRSELVLTLGYTRDPATAIVSRPADLWTYNGTAWTQRGTVTPLPGYTLSGTLTGGAANSQVTLRAGTATGAVVGATVTLNAQGSGTYSLSGIPAGEALYLSALDQDTTLAYPNNHWSFLGVELPALLGNTTQNLTLPPGPLVRLETSGQFILPASFRGTLYYLAGVPELDVPGFPRVPNGVHDVNLDYTPQFAMAYPPSTATQRQRMNTYLSSTQGCEDHGLFTLLTPSTNAQVAVTGSASALSPGVPECTPSGLSSGLGLARDRLSWGNGLDQPVVDDLDKDTFPDVVYAGTQAWDAVISWGGPDFSLNNAQDLCCDATEPQAVAVGDFNKDGKSDLAIPRPVTGHAMVKLADPATPRTFLAATSYQVGTKPSGIATADVNGDGNLDLVVASQDTGTAAYLAGNGIGTFQTAQTVTLSGTSPRAVLLTNVDGDAKPDLVVVMAEGISVALDGASNGPFGASTLITAGTQPSAVVVGKLNGDATPDMAVANEGSNTVTLHLGSGGGTFAAPTQLNAGTGPAGLALADFTGDGHLDLAVSSSGDGVVTLFQGASNGAFALHSKVQVPGTPRGLAAVDHNGDGLKDLVVASPTPGLVTLLPGVKSIPITSATSFTFTAPANSRFMWSMHALNGGPRYWDYYAPVQAGTVTYALPLASTLASSSAPVAPTSGKVMSTWNPWVKKWEPTSSTPFNPNQYFLNMLGHDAETQPGAHHYMWP